MTATILERIAFDGADKQAERYVRGKESLSAIALQAIASKAAALFAIAGCPEYADFWRGRADGDGVW